MPISSIVSFRIDGRGVNRNGLIVYTLIRSQHLIFKVPIQRTNLDGVDTERTCPRTGEAKKASLRDKELDKDIKFNIS